MEKEDARKQSQEVLHERRKQVIRMHRKGVAVMKIVAQTGLRGLEIIKFFFGTS